MIDLPLNFSIIHASPMKTIFDLHCDTPINIRKKKFMHIIPGKIKSSGYLGAVFAHWVAPKIKRPFEAVLKSIPSTFNFLRNIPSVKIIHRISDIDMNKTNILLGVEGGHIFDHDLTHVEVLYELGIRVFTLTWNNSNRLAHSAIDDDKKGLTQRGRGFVKMLNSYNVIIDTSHSSTRTVLDLCEISKNAVIASHSCVRALNRDFLRNIDDRAIKAIVKHGGVIGINLSRKHLGSHSVLEHINYLVKNFGIRSAAIGTDFDGINDPVYPRPSKLGLLQTAMRKDGYSASEIQKIFSGNFINMCRRFSI